MITNFKIFENKEYVNLTMKQNATLYLEEIIPISNDDGFITCQYDDDDNSDKFILISFYFNQNTKENIFRKFEKFLNANDLKIFDINKNYHLRWSSSRLLFSGRFSPLEIVIENRVKLYKDKIEEYSDLYINIKNFNL